MKKKQNNKITAIQIEGKQFRKMQLLELDMLIEFDRVCRINNIKYTIFGGSLLGAVRHNGYIPWDDDADIAMLREDYEKFKKVSNQLDSKICFFQDNETDEYYRWGYGKLRRTGTTFVRCGQSHLKAKTGLFVDVFPMDDVPLSVFGQIFLDFKMFVLRKILWAEVGKISESNFFKRLIYKALSRISPTFVFKKVKKLSNKSKNSSKNRVRCLLFPSTGKLYKKNPVRIRYSMPKQWFTELQEYNFENVKLYGTKDYDSILKYIYGDYLALPPEDARTPHSPVEYYDFGDSVFKKIYSLDERVKKIIFDNRFKNPYLYIDINTFGFFESNKFETYIAECNGEINAVVFKYYNTAQALQLTSNKIDLFPFVHSNKIEMVTANLDLINSFEGSGFKRTTGTLMLFDPNQKDSLSNYIDSYEIINAEESDFAEIAKLICSDVSIGGHYNIESLAAQLLERNKKYGCKNVVCKINNRIVCHVATYAEMNDLAIIGGVITDISYRGRGIAKAALSSLVKCLLDERKSPLLYCYDKQNEEFYKKIGFRICENVGKLERKIEDD